MNRAVVFLLGFLFSCAAAPLVPTERLLTSTDKPVWWDSFPLQLCADQATINDIGWHIEAAADWWHMKTGEQLFRTDGGAHECDVWFSTDKDLIERYVDEGDAGSTIPIADRETGRVDSTAVLVRPYLESEQLNRVVAHELGHVIGLGHSESTWSVMYFRAVRTPWEIELADVATVRAIVAERRRANAK